MSTRNTTVKHLPAAAYDRLQQRARRNHRSLNQEMVHILCEAVAADVPEGALPVELAGIRARYVGVAVIEADVRALREAGRP
jgi:plasmid stability protein